MCNPAMIFDVKALLTLLLLKQGTSAKDIQTAVNLTAAARLMVAEEYADSNETQDSGNVTSLRSARHGEAPTARPFEPHADAMNSDIKALLMLLLLQNGASSREIQTTLRLATKSRSLAADEPSDMSQEAVQVAEVTKALETRPVTPKQALRAEHLAPIALRDFAA
jgi:hypothetical protein